MTRRRHRTDDASPSGIGDVLGAARRGMGISLDDAAKATHLRESYLAALERDDVAGLGLDPAYVRGTLRTYADHLGLDSGELLERLRVHTVAAEAPGAGEPAGTAPVQVPSRRVPALLAGVIGLLVLAFGAFALGETLARRVVRPTPGGAGGAVARDDTAVLARSGGGRGPEGEGERQRAGGRGSDRPSEPGTAAPAPAPLTLRLEVVEPTWVRVKTDGTTDLAGRADRSVERFEADRRIVVRVAEPGAVKLTFNGERYGRMARKRDGPVKIACDAHDGCEVVK